MNPIQSFKEASTPKKIATVATAAAVVGSLAYAAKTGKVADTFEGGKAKKIAAKVGNGYAELGKKAVAGAKTVWGKVTSKVADFKAAHGKKAAEKVAEATQDLGAIVE